MLSTIFMLLDNIDTYIIISNMITGIIFILCAIFLYLSIRKTTKNLTKNDNDFEIMCKDLPELQFMENEKQKLIEEYAYLHIELASIQEICQHIKEIQMQNDSPCDLKDITEAQEMLEKRFVEKYKQSTQINDLIYKQQFIIDTYKETLQKVLKGEIINDEEEI